VTDAVVVLIAPQGLGQRVSPVGEWQVTAAIQRPHVPVRLPIYHPFRDDPASTAGLYDPKSERAAVEEVAHARGRTYQRIAVRRIRDRAVDHPLHAHRSEKRQARASRLDVGLYARKIVIKKLV